MYVQETTADTVTRTKKEKLSPAERKRILLVDDEETLVYSWTRLLDRLGYDVTGFSCPLEALEAFYKVPFDFDVVLTDLNMPGMTGEELALRIWAKRSCIPIVLITGYEGDPVIGDLVRVRFTKICQKPVTEQHLNEVLHSVLPEQGSCA